MLLSLLMLGTTGSAASGSRPSILLAFIQRDFGNRKWIIYITIPVARGWRFDRKTGGFRRPCIEPQGKHAMCRCRRSDGNEKEIYRSVSRRGQETTVQLRDVTEANWEAGGALRSTELFYLVTGSAHEK
jgi:hypothetical protein